jgi:hypothetical protein
VNWSGRLQPRWRVIRAYNALVGATDGIITPRSSRPTRPRTSQASRDRCPARLASAPARAVPRSALGTLTITVTAQICEKVYRACTQADVRRLGESPRRDLRCRHQGRERSRQPPARPLDWDRSHHATAACPGTRCCLRTNPTTRHTREGDSRRGALRRGPRRSLARPKLGYAQLGAVANFTNRFTESDDNNNFFKGEHFAVIARQWDVPYFETIVSIPGEGTRTTASQSSFHFEFSYYDHSKAVYVYNPMGSITSTMLYAGGLCSGTGSLTDSKAPWAGFLHIAGDFRYYDALVQTVSIPYTVPVNCIVFSRTVPEAFDDLDTSADRTFPVTNEQATKVTGDFSSGLRNTEWKWQFRLQGAAPAAA